MRKYIITATGPCPVYGLPQGTTKVLRKKYQTKLKRDIPLTTLYSALDEKIFSGYWTLRQGWTRYKGRG